MPLKKSELYASLWRSCDELRGGMDASQYKDYVLALLFMKYVSDKASSQPDYDLIVPAGGAFQDMVALKGKPDIGDGINKVIARLAEANDTLGGAIDVADFNDDDKLGKGKAKVDLLTNLVAIFENPALDFRGNSAEGDDLLGDAYEYLMRNFATESGKSKGQFYTPAEVSRLMAQLVGVTRATSQEQSIYDPTCGSGSLLLKAHDAARSATGHDLAIYGQEMDNATAALARMNMVLHDAVTAEIIQDNTLSLPGFLDGAGGLKRFDFVVANPPFSTKSWMKGFDPEHDEYNRFEYGMPPKRNGDYAFLLHMLTSLKAAGRAAVILPHGVLFRGNSEAAIRGELLRRGFIEGIIGLPPNLFYGTGIAACVIVLDKAGAADRDAIFLVDASRGFTKDGNKNRLREQDIHRIVDVYLRRVEADRYSRLVPLAEIRENDFNLNIARYIEGWGAEDTQSVVAHMRGGIPAEGLDQLGAHWAVMPSLRPLLFEEGDDGLSRLRVGMEAVRAAITGHSEFVRFVAGMQATVDGWCGAAEPGLRSIALGDRPRDLMSDLAETVLAAFGTDGVVDGYSAYQRFMDYWASTLQDDVFMIVQVGWAIAAKPHPMDESDLAREAPDFVLAKQRFKSDLLPARVVVGRYFPEEASSIEALASTKARSAQEAQAILETHGVEGGLLEDVVDDRGKLARRAAATRLREVRDDPEVADEKAVLEAYIAAVDAEAEAKSALKTADAAMAEKLGAKYASLTVEEIIDLVVCDKWLADLRSLMADEIEAATRALLRRISTLTVRYETSLPAIQARSTSLAAEVDEHLRRMGVTW